VVFVSNAVAIFKQENILRYPRLDTVLMVEEAIQKAKEYPTKAELLRSLPKKMMYQTFNTIIDYLEYSGKIYIDKDGAIVWIWNPKLVQKYMKRPDLSWRPEK
jgi:ABC-type branched-subunit amino acid transport system substrate-binding protein